MQITMRETGTRSVLELGSFLSSSDGWELEGKSQTEIYDWVQKEMVAWEYLRQGKKERGVIRAYMEKMTGSGYGKGLSRTPLITLKPRCSHRFQVRA
jgi:hypothetical protein